VRRLRDLVAGFIQVAHGGKTGVAEIVPDAGRAGHDIGLAAAIADDIMRTLDKGRCSRRKFHATSINSTPSSAERPSHGMAAAWAVLPWNVYSTETMPFMPRSP
jgi:hypothetical protein